MNVLLKSVKIIDPGSDHHKSKRDIHIRNGIIEKIGQRLRVKDAKIVEPKQLHVSPGWMDLHANFCDPGFEHKEDLDSGMNAAMRGGFTGVAVMPSTEPAIDSKTQVDYLLNKSSKSPVDVYPIAALTKKFNGHDLTEMQDLHTAGAVAFSQGTKSIGDAGLMMRSLQYVKAFGGIIFHLPDDPSISNGASVNEGKVSVEMGMKGHPSIAEELIVNRDIQLLKYTESKLHLLQLSSAGSIDLLKKAKKDELKISASVSPYHLIFDESDVAGFDSNFKFSPPLRSAKDRKALLKAVKDGVIDTLVSMHMPHEEDAKKMEFEAAETGVIGLESLYGLVNTELGKSLGQERLVQLLAIKPREVLGLPVPHIKEGALANMTLFDPKQEWTYTGSSMASKSRNSPFIGRSFVGQVKGIINSKKAKFFG